MTEAEIYRREADRLRSMADAFQYGVAREEFLRIADHYDGLVRQLEQGRGHADKRQGAPRAVAVRA